MGTTTQALGLSIPGSVINREISLHSCSPIRPKTSSQKDHMDKRKTNSPPLLQKITDLRPLAIFADGISTEEISPSGEISQHSPAGKFLLEEKKSNLPLGSFAHYREDHHVLIRGAFSHPQLKNRMTPEVTGGYTQYFGDAHIPHLSFEIKSPPEAQATFIYDAAFAYQQSGRKLIIIAGEDYGSGPPSEWAAQVTSLLGVQCLLTKSIDETHRVHLISRGILPLTFKKNSDYDRLTPMHSCTFSISDFPEKPQPMQEITLQASCGFHCKVIMQIKSPSEMQNYLTTTSSPYSLNQFFED